MGDRRGELAKRVAVALVGIPIALGLAYLGGYWLGGFLAALAAAAAWEYYSMNRSRGVPSFARLGSLLALSFVLMATGLDPASFAIWATVFALAAVTVAVLSAAPDSDSGLASAVTVFGALYTGGLIAFAIWLRALDGAGPGWRGTAILFLPVAVTWIGDTAAYFAGRALGRHKLAPTISPAKTWEGAVAGLGATVGGAVLYVGLTRPLVGWTLSFVDVLGFGAAVAVAGQAGDLIESRFKRDCRVKDSSRLLPGHGGVLDRLDSLLFVFPIGYAYLSLVGA